MNQAVVLGNNDVAFLAWSYDAPIDDCLGFAVYRQSASQPSPTPLPAWVGFEGESNENWQPKTTEQWPVQKFSWRDLTAAAGATYHYEIVPMVGEPGSLTPREDLRLKTAQITLTPERSKHFRAYFNRGILSTQHLVHSLPQGPDGGPSSTSLLAHITTVGDPLRGSLAGQQIEALAGLLIRAIHDGGTCHGAIYELNDPELIGLLDTPNRISLVLSNAGEGVDGDDTNKDARARLHGDGIDVTDRMFKSGHIGHNKFVVYTPPGDTPSEVLTGSTNWTYTGVCAQSNNALHIVDKRLAKTYKAYWELLRLQSPQNVKATQTAEMRVGDRKPHNFTIDKAKVQLWFSPNTDLQNKPPGPDAPRPVDIAEVYSRIAAAKKGIFFLLFQPGSPSVLDAIIAAQNTDQELFIRGAATDPKAIGDFETRLIQRPGDPMARVAAAAAFGGAKGPAPPQLALWE
jgi:hypothetical protein